MAFDARLAMLKQYFGYDRFLGGQEQAVDTLLAGRDLLAVMPTGAGKSICFQLPALCLPGTTLVVSPLISLMADQVMALRQAGVSAAYLNRSLTERQYALALQYARMGRYKLIYVAPERLQTPGFLSFARQADISLLAVDEAHCVSQWGQDFRPSYLEIPAFLSQLSHRPPVGAFTATATPAVREDIIRQLDLRQPERIVTGFDRPGLRFVVQRPADKMQALRQIIAARRDESGIVYCATRKAVEEVCLQLRQAGIDATRYHAGLSQEERQQNQQDFLYDRCRVCVATNAFGMGIDKSNVRYVVHYNMPLNLEGYYQEAGRAGRDGAEAECILLYAKSDVRLAQFMLDNRSFPDTLDEEAREALRQRDAGRLEQMTFYSTTHSCLRQFLLRYFGQPSGSFCGNCSSCLALQAARAPQPAPPVPPAARAGTRGADGDLYQRLRALRVRIARREGLPPFLVFSDRTLQEMARLRPRSETAMLAVTGVGKHKLEQYGTEFLDEIRRYSRK